MLQDHTVTLSLLIIQIFIFIICAIKYSQRASQIRSRNSYLCHRCGVTRHKRLYFFPIEYKIPSIKFLFHCNCEAKNQMRGNKQQGHGEAKADKQTWDNKRSFEKFREEWEQHYNKRERSKKGNSAPELSQVRIAVRVLFKTDFVVAWKIWIVIYRRMNCV